MNNAGSLTMTSCTVSGNSVTGPYYSGGGVSNTGSLTMTNCIVSGNSAAFGGGGVYSYYGSLAMANCTVCDNTATRSAFADGGGVRRHWLGDHAHQL